MAIEAQHGDNPAIKPKLSKACPKLKSVRGIKTFSCSVCLVFSRDVRSLREHMRCHEKTHACTVSGCAQSFSTSRDLTRHVKSAHSNTFLTCSICFAPIKGNRTDNLRRHIKTRHSAQAIAQSSPSDFSSWSSPGDYTSM
ncbi:hypothetical protein K456DRAFT_446919 [Colletotrichum gloeosporioides 23]|nr:hypothetical protein K456DRAFT_446919 [Colletotrichum gloeosporioides 23]